MCYLVYLSTTNREDLSHLSSTLYHFLPLTTEDDLALVKLLDHPILWYLECQYGGCSCHFRYLCEGNDMAFAPPADWSPEEVDDIEATKTVYDVLAKMLADGHKVDIIAVWDDAQAEAITVRDVSLSEVDRDSFRFFENHKFNFSE